MATIAQSNAFTAAAPRVFDCSCKHEYQDKRYGMGLRLHNPCKEKKFRCTVCGNLKERS